jgi:23S rRNA (guanine2445-N2)-methyltransferase / 23S rRNA (guanine2069-N7)-methyltransferase
MTESLFATAPHGAEDLLVDELRALGLESKPQIGGAGFRGSLEDALRACLWLRTASRLLLELGELPAEDGDRLYAGVRSIDWSTHLERGATFAVHASGTGSIGHGHYAALRVKDAIVDQLRERWGTRPDVDTAEPDISLRVHLRGDRARLSLDLGGEGLHRRGYRVEQGAAPLRENLAAAVLLRVGWKGEGPLLDPFCGAATLLIEAAWIAADVAPGLLRRRWGFSRWPGRDDATWARLLAQAEQRRVEGLARLAGRSPLLGFDADSRTIRAAIACIEAAGLRGRVHVERRELDQLAAPGSEPGLIVCNPPWGERLGTRRELERLYASFGALLRERFVGWEVAVLAGDPGLGRFLGISAHRRNVLHDGPIEAQILRMRVEPARPEQAPAERRPRSDGATAFANRLKKNRKKLASWLERESITCFRLYDADIPEYNVAVDLYREAQGEGLLHAHVQEYAPPRSIDPEQARTHLREALAVIREDLELPRERVHLKRRERQRGRSQYEKLDRAGQEYVVAEGPARFLVNFEDYLDTGLFLDHRPIRAKLRELAAGRRMLNLFCYTATASVHAAIGGASSTTSVDLSRTYLEWAQRNFAINGFEAVQAASHAQPGRHRLIRTDVLDWLGRPTRERWELIFCDPPSYSNSKRMQQDFDVQRDHGGLIARCVERLAPGGTLVFSTNLRSFELDPRAVDRLEVEDWTTPSIPKDFERSQRIHRCYLIRRR